LNIIVEVAEEWLVYLAILYLVHGMTRAKKKAVRVSCALPLIITALDAMFPKSRRNSNPTRSGINIVTQFG